MFGVSDPKGSRLPQRPMIPSQPSCRSHSIYLAFFCRFFVA